MKTCATPLVVSLLLASSVLLSAAPDPRWLAHDRDRPAPPVVNPGTASTQDRAGQPPSDATVLFDGKDLSAWVDMAGNPTKWVVKDGAMECVPGSGYIRSLQGFGDCQLHVEWAAPLPVKGDSQGRGNSGVFLGLGRYEVQVLDSHDNRTYSDGSAASIYGQYPPLVNATRSPGEWQTYDIIWTAPRFGADGKLASAARITVLHNGVLVQNNVELTGPTDWIGRKPYQAHPERLPIAFQDHGNPVRYRNVWVRELGARRFPAFVLSDALLDSYAGSYGQEGQWNRVQIRRLADGQLSITLAGSEEILQAASPTHFYAGVTDIQCKFEFSGGKKKLLVTVGDDFSRAMVMERKEP